MAVCESLVHVIVTGSNDNFVLLTTWIEVRFNRHRRGCGSILVKGQQSGSCRYSHSSLLLVNVREFCVFTNPLVSLSGFISFSLVLWRLSTQNEPWLRLGFLTAVNAGEDAVSLFGLYRVKTACLLIDAVKLFVPMMTRIVTEPVADGTEPNGTGALRTSPRRRSFSGKTACHVLYFLYAVACFYTTVFSGQR